MTDGFYRRNDSIQKTQRNGFGKCFRSPSPMLHVGNTPAGQMVILKHDVGQILDVALLIQMASGALDCKSERNAFATSAQLIEEHAEKLNADIDRLQKSLSN